MSQKLFGPGLYVFLNKALYLGGRSQLASAGGDRPEVIPTLPEEGEHVARFQCYRTEESRIRWRLLGGNNRIVCLGPQWHADLVTAVAEVALVRLVAPGAQIEIEHNETLAGRHANQRAGIPRPQYAQRGFVCCRVLVPVRAGRPLVGPAGEHRQPEAGEPQRLA